MWFYAVLEIEPRPSCMLGKQSTNWATSPALGYVFSVLKCICVLWGIALVGWGGGKGSGVMMSYGGRRLETSIGVQI